MSTLCGKPTKKGGMCTQRVTYPGGPCAAAKFHTAEAAFGSGLMLSAVDAIGLDLGDGPVSNRNWVGQGLVGSTFHDSTFEGNDFTMATLDESILSKIRMSDVTAVRASFREVMGDNVQVAGSNMRESDWTMARVQGMAADHTHWDDSEWYGAVVSGRFSRCDFDRAHFQAADLHACRFDHCSFDGATYDGRTLWPSGFDPVRAGAVMATGTALPA